jgi:hypothetical protein
MTPTSGGRSRTSCNTWKHNLLILFDFYEIDRRSPGFRPLGFLEKMTAVANRRRPLFPHGRNSHCIAAMILGPAT